MYPKVFTWPALSTTAIATLQTLVGAGDLTLDGSLATKNSRGTGQNYIQFVGYSRTVTLTSVNNLSGRNFTITGTYRGIAQVEVIAGPNNNTVTTTSLFDTVTQISVNGAVAAVSAGTGASGQLPWEIYNYHCTVANLAIQVNVTGTINYSFNVTLDDVQTNPTPILFNPIAAMTGATTDQLANLTIPVRYYDISIASGTGSLVATIIQQGIN